MVGHPCHLSPFYDGILTGWCLPSLMHAVIITVSSHVQLPFCTQKTHFLKVIYHLWLLQLSSLHFPKIPDPMGRGIWQTFNFIIRILTQILLPERSYSIGNEHKSFYLSSYSYMLSAHVFEINLSFKLVSIFPNKVKIPLNLPYLSCFVFIAQSSLWYIVVQFLIILGEKIQVIWNLTFGV